MSATRLRVVQCGTGNIGQRALREPLDVEIGFPIALEDPRPRGRQQADLAQYLPCPCGIGRTGAHR